MVDLMCEMSVVRPTQLYYVRPRRGDEIPPTHFVVTMRMLDYVPQIGGDFVVDCVPESLLSSAVLGDSLPEGHTVYLSNFACVKIDGQFFVDLVRHHNLLSQSCDNKRANDSLVNSSGLSLSPQDRWVIQQMTEFAYYSVMDALLIDTKNDPNSIETPRRVAKMLVNEVFAGRYKEAPKNTSFANARNFGGNYIVGPIALKSMCAHHHIPIVGEVYISVFLGDEPGDCELAGLSKFSRITDWLMRRPQNQEELTKQIAEQVLKITKMKGCAVVIKGQHLCMTHRGVEEPNSFHITSYVDGAYRENPDLKSEVLSLVMPLLAK